jgi:O-antigen ligase
MSFISWAGQKFSLTQPDLAWFVQTRYLFGLCALVIVSGLLAGGGTRPGFASDAILQYIAIPLLLTAVWRMTDVPIVKSTRLAFAFCLALPLIPLLQLIPLPPWIWMALPYRQVSAAAFDLLGRDPPWMPISVSPHATWLSALSFLPPVAIFLGVGQLGLRERRTMSLVILAVGLLSAFLGLLQLAQGPLSPLRFFAFTNINDAVGFFANRNHFAALLYTLTLFSAAWAVDVAMTIGPQLKQKRYETASLVRLVVSFTVLVVLVAAQTMARSRAGISLSIVALVGAWALAFSVGRGGLNTISNRLIVGATSLAMVFSAQYSLYRVLSRFEADPLRDGRTAFARNTIEAAMSYMPFGSGMGTFTSVYGMFEERQDVLLNHYANHAHNDILELWLETGVLAFVLILLFIVWLMLRSTKAWRKLPHPGRAIDRLLPRAATLAVSLLIAHSFVDYPLRTSAMMTIFAFACALLTEPPAEAEVAHHAVAEGVQERPGHEEAVQPPAPAAPVAFPVPPAQSAPPPAQAADIEPELSRPPAKRWGEEIEWPEEWREPAKQDSAGRRERPQKPDKP